MKKLIPTLSLLLFVGALLAQESWTFRHEYQPNAKYRTDMQLDMDMGMVMQMPPEMREELGEEEPDTVQMQMMMFFGIGMETMQETEAELPFAMTYDSIAMAAKMNGEEMPLPQSTQMDMMKGIVIKGHITDKKMSMDSMAGVAITPEMSDAMQTNLQGIQMMLNFPEEPMKIGDSFSQINQQQVNTAGTGPMTVDVKLTLTLQAVEGDLATFSTTEVYDFAGAVSTTGAKMGGEGTGVGTLIFNRPEQRITSYINDSTMKMKMDMSAQTGMDMKMDVDTKNHIVISNVLLD